jgi:heme exporter protein C
MGFRDDVYILVTVCVNIIASYAALIAAPIEINMGELYRIFYTHLPIALVCYISLGISFAASIAFLRKKTPIYDRLAEVSAIWGLLYGAAVLVTGSIWANTAWGVYWNWDPRETTTLILWIAYVGYIALRSSIDNVERRAVVGSTYNILAFSTVPLSYLSFILWESLHPRLSNGGQLNLTLPMMETLFLNMVAALLVFLYLLKLTFTVFSLQEQVNQLALEEGGDE